MKPNITLQSFPLLDESAVASSIYAGRDRQITDMGLILSPDVQRELDRFISDYLIFGGFPEMEPSFLRIDAYINPDGSAIQILDVNASFVDGWGNALNLTRSIGYAVDRTLLESFPQRMILSDEAFRPEFDLARRELSMLWSGDTNAKIFKEAKEKDSRIATYIYGNPDTNQKNLYPYDALRMDSKMILARFSETWSGTSVQIPRIYTPQNTMWNSLPSDGVFKLASKRDIQENPNVRRVQIGVKSSNRGLQSLWDTGRCIVQEKTPTMQDGCGNNIQAILLATRGVVAGYTQFSPKSIINDDSIQGPLLLSA